MYCHASAYARTRAPVSAKNFAEDSHSSGTCHACEPPTATEAEGDGERAGNRNAWLFSRRFEELVICC